MLLDIIMESLLSMDNETLDYALESMSAEELEIVNDYISGATESADDDSDDAYMDALEAAVYELNDMSEDDVIAVLESLDEDVVDDLIAMEGIISGTAKLAGKAAGSAVKAAHKADMAMKRGADTVDRGISKTKDALSQKLNEARLYAIQQTPTFRAMGTKAGAAARSAGSAIKNEVNADVATAKYAAGKGAKAIKNGIDRIRADAANAKGSFKDAYDGTKESADVVASIRDKILAQYEQ